MENSITLVPEGSGDPRGDVFCIYHQLRAEGNGRGRLRLSKQVFSNLAQEIICKFVSLFQDPLLWDSISRHEELVRRRLNEHSAYLLTQSWYKAEGVLWK